MSFSQTPGRNDNQIQEIPFFNEDLDGRPQNKNQANRDMGDEGGLNAYDGDEKIGENRRNY